MRFLVALAFVVLPSVANAQSSVPTDNRGDSYASARSKEAAVAATTSRLGMRWGKNLSKRTTRLLGGGRDVVVPLNPPDPRDKFDDKLKSLETPTGR